MEKGILNETVGEFRNHFEVQAEYDPHLLARVRFSKTTILALNDMIKIDFDPTIETVNYLDRKIADLHNIQNNSQSKPAAAVLEINLINL